MSFSALEYPKRAISKLGSVFHLLSGENWKSMFELLAGTALESYSKAIGSQPLAIGPVQCHRPQSFIKF